ncbi:hypothetical protein PENTCL1PPCAC_6389, partial [Pristionchus entomophagus]
LFPLPPLSLPSLFPLSSLSLPSLFPLSSLSLPSLFPYHLDITRWLAIAAAIHHNLGLRHILLVTLITLYTLLGGLMFQALESQNEYNNLLRTIGEMDELMDEFVSDIQRISTNEMNQTLTYDMLIHKTKVFYEEMLKTEDRYLGSAWHKAENLDLHLQWNLNSAIFYSFTVFTTLGYGSIACETWTGRWISIVYASCGIPLMLLTIGDLGELIQRKLCILIDFIVRKFRSIRKKTDEVEIDVERVSTYSGESDEEEERLPVWLSITLLISYTALVSLAVYLFDKGEYGEPGIDMQSSFYFVFISITTIGFGDVMPSSIQYHIPFIFAFLFGLTLLSIVNSSVYASLYDAFYTGVTTMESSLDSIHARVHMRDGHRLFKSLHPAFSTLILSFPLSTIPRRRHPNILLTQASLRKDTDSSLDSIGSINERSQSTCLPPMKSSVERREAIKRVQSAYTRPRVPTYGNVPSSPRSRVNQSPMERHNYRKRAPTIGPFGGIDIVRQKRRESQSRSLSPNRNKDNL